MDKTIIDLEKLLRTPCVDADHPFDISPDGTRVAFSWNKSGQWEIYELHLDDPGVPARQITSGEGGKFSPRYSPDGDRLAYMVDFDGSESFKLFIHHFASGEQTNLTSNEPGALQPNFDWSPDGKHIAFISNRTGCFKTCIMPATGGNSQLVLDTPYPDWDVRWSPDGHYLLVNAQTLGQDFGAFILPVEGGTAKQITDRNGPLNSREPRWSPDGGRIAFASDARGYYDIGVYALATSEVTWLTQGSGDKTSPTWSADGRYLSYIHHEEGVTCLVVHEFSKASNTTYQVGPGLHNLPEFTPDGDALLCVFDNPSHPDDLWCFSLKDGTIRQLTDSLPIELQGSPFAMPTILRVPGLDGAPVPALLYQPPPTGELSPAVVLVHGGPNWRFDVMWFPLVQHMVSRGWVVLQPNYRGSTGYGREWQYASRFDMGGVDTRDVVAGANYLVNNGLADPTRVAVTGSSHGGYLTMTALTQFPEVWAAGSAVVPFLNWFTSNANSRDDLQYWDHENFGDPVTNHDLWYERSPFFFLDRVNAPVQFICGANDPRCPVSESIAARDALQALEKPVDFVLYPDEGHGFLKTGNVIDAALRRVSFLAQALEKPD